MMPFMLNLVLALLWCALVGSVSIADFNVGFVGSYLLLWLLRPLLGDSRYFTKLPQLVGFVTFFLIELVKSNFRVAWDVVTPRARHRPGVVAVPLDARTEAEITVLANVITLTPGTLSLDVSGDNSILYVHAMFVDDPETLKREIKQGFERRVLELLR